MYPTALSVSHGVYRTVSQQSTDETPDPPSTSSATPTLDIKAISIHSVSYRSLWALDYSVSADPDPHLPALPHLRQV